ncbi:hypothetical protein SKAU_G00098870 [Synaphobranchus kaupii]|uniref:Uncharacterized protein n=1 Tax=Synaphobranchus kaupii TaxID=118154 RepID=A0A9Q1J6X6_SYNKA|nr:hypothetical protein SKAU_G00098870 [Synaphobranchus kaupii]
MAATLAPELAPPPYPTPRLDLRSQNCGGIGKEDKAPEWSHLDLSTFDRPRLCRSDRAGGGRDSAQLPSQVRCRGDRGPTERRRVPWGPHLKGCPCFRRIGLSVSRPCPAMLRSCSTQTCAVCEQSEVRPANDVSRGASLRRRGTQAAATKQKSPLTFNCRRNRMSDYAVDHKTTSTSPRNSHEKPPARKKGAAPQNVYPQDTSWAKPNVRTDPTVNCSRFESGSDRSGHRLQTQRPRKHTSKGCGLAITGTIALASAAARTWILPAESDTKSPLLLSCACINCEWRTSSLRPRHPLLFPKVTVKEKPSVLSSAQRLSIHSSGEDKEASIPQAEAGESPPRPALVIARNSTLHSATKKEPVNDAHGKASRFRATGGGVRSINRWRGTGFPRALRQLISCQ